MDKSNCISENIHPRTCAIHCLVDDLLCLIFIECLPTIPISDPRFPTIFMQSHPLNVLTNVCTQWRELAVGTSELWRDIHIDFVHCDVDYKAGFWNELGKGILEFWFDQSAAHMLHVELIIEEPSYADPYWDYPKHQNLDISFPRCMRSFDDAFSMLPWASGSWNHARPGTCSSRLYQTPLFGLNGHLQLGFQS
ncbi:MAG: hypothetical protein NXY57DRAFT_907208 [Lentinula lateritia]|nr:MAG: hypothetical protein NXY57DRAFT_907208 [Lentinula lateritia]